MRALLILRYATACLTAICLCYSPAIAAELELKSLGAMAEGTKPKRQIGPYVSVAAGETMGQSGTTRVGDRSLPMDDLDGSAIFSMEVGKTWNYKRVPLQFSLAAEATFMSTTLQGRTSPAGLAPTDLAEYEADMNLMVFSLNGTLALDLYRYRARLGKILGGFKPYVGGGMGGGQVWFRNATGRSASQLGGGSIAPSDLPFGIDEFVNAWNWRAGVEWTWEERYSIFFEYRDSHLGGLDNLRNFSTDGYLVGFRYRY